LKVEQKAEDFSSYFGIAADFVRTLKRRKLELNNCVLRCIMCFESVLIK